MRHLRSDYDAIQPFPTKRPHIVRTDDGEVVDAGDGTVAGTPIELLGIHMNPIIPDDEPVFILRGQDPSSGPAVRAWADDVEARGGDPELVARVREWAMVYAEKESTAQEHTNEHRRDSGEERGCCSPSFRCSNQRRDTGTKEADQGRGDATSCRNESTSY